MTEFGGKLPSSTEPEKPGFNNANLTKYYKLMHSKLVKHSGQENNMENGGGGGIEWTIPLCKNRVISINVC